MRSIIQRAFRPLGNLDRLASHIPGGSKQDQAREARRPATSCTPLSIATGDRSTEVSAPGGFVALYSKGGLTAVRALIAGILERHHVDVYRSQDGPSPIDYQQFLVDHRGLVFVQPGTGVRNCPNSRRLVSRTHG
jgi:hypothetical protein